MSKKNPQAYLVAATWPQELYGVDDNADFKYAATPDEAKKIVRELEKKGATSTSIAMVIPEDLPELIGKHVCSECGDDNITFIFSPDVPLNGTVDFVINGNWGFETLYCENCGDNIENTDWVRAA